MPSFDIVSEVEQHEISNAVDQANREIEIRFDLKGSGAKFELSTDKIMQIASSEFQLKQLEDILKNKFVKRGLDIRALTFEKPAVNLSEAKQEVLVRQGFKSEEAKTLVKWIKEEGFKVQASIQGEQIRVTGKKRDDLQAVIAFLREKNTQWPLEYKNFRDN